MRKMPIEKNKQVASPISTGEALKRLACDSIGLKTCKPKRDLGYGCDIGEPPVLVMSARESQFEETSNRSLADIMDP